MNLPSAPLKAAESCGESAWEPDAMTMRPPPPRGNGDARASAVAFLEDVGALREAAQKGLHQPPTAERQRRHSDGQTRLQQILQALPEAVYTTDAAGVVTYCNRAVVAMSGR